MRLLVYNKQECTLINVLKREVHPRDRSNIPMRALRVLYFPMYYHKIMERLNLLHYSLNAYTREFARQAAYAYPMLTC
jgi:hypothetical protein